MLRRKTMQSLRWFLAAPFVLSCIVTLGHCIEENNLFQNDLTKEMGASEVDLQHGIEQHDIGLTEHKNAVLHEAESVVDNKFEKMEDDNIAVESGSQVVHVTETAPKSFISEASDSEKSVVSSKPPPTLCLCNPPCESFNSTNDLEKTESCSNGRFVTRKDCPCCRVCAKQEGESCASPNDVCDKEFGLQCSPEDKICVPEVACTEDSSCPDDQHCLWGACVDPCPLLRPCSLPEPLDQDLHPTSSPSSPRGGICVVRAHRPLCECPQGTVLKGAECVGQESASTTEESNDVSGPGKKKLGSISKPTDGSKVQLKVLSISHNSSLLQLPSSAGGELFYKSLSSSGGKGMVAVSEQGSDTFTLQNLKPSSSYALNWLGKDGTVAEREIKTQDGCTQGSDSFGVGEQFTIGCHSKCFCSPSGQNDCMPRCMDSQVKDLAKPPQEEGCTAVPVASDPECCVTFRCDGITGSKFSSSGAPNLIVMETTHQSVTLAWDDFRSGNQDAVYTAQYRQKVDEGETVNSWLDQAVEKTMAPPTVTLDDLNPSTTYEVRVSILDETAGIETEEHTETLTVSTKPGCVYMNVSYAEGSFNRGCEEACTCMPSGNVNCTERCTIPYFKRGKFKGDELCSEQPNVADECCVLVVCQTNSGSQDYDPCVNIVCGPNAQCVSDRIHINNASSALSSNSQISSESSGSSALPQLTHDVSPHGHCKCLKGFEGNPTNLETGCVPVTPGGEECHHHNQTYQPGEVFYDKCISRCFCRQTGEIDCQPRCPTLPPLQDGCEIVQDPTDDCCKMHACPNTTLTEVQVLPTSQDGCLYGNKSYERHETFTDGCTFKCVCLGYGDVSCSPRCSPLKKTSPDSVPCQTLPDPLDACCSITICDDHLDVMKENISESLLGSEIEEPIQTTTVMSLESGIDTNDTSNLTHQQIHEMGIPHSHADTDSHMHKTMNDSHRLMHEQGISHSHGPGDEHYHEQLHKQEIISHSQEGEHVNGSAITSPNFSELSHAEIHEMGIVHNHDEHGNPIPISKKENNKSKLSIIRADDHEHMHKMGIPHSHHEGEHHAHETMDEKHEKLHMMGIPHSHADNETHTHVETGDGHHNLHEMGIPHSHGEDESHTHEIMDDDHRKLHEMEVLHTHDENEPHTHVHAMHGHHKLHEMGVPHSHGENESHTHDQMDEEHRKLHEMGMAHSHDANEPHTHSQADADHEKLHEMGIIHSHSENEPHTHETNSDNHQKLHEMEVPHSHDENESHTHDQMDEEHRKLHELGMAHSHDANEPHTHSETDADHEQLHEMGIIHSHSENEPHTHETIMDDHHKLHEMEVPHSHGENESHSHAEMDDDHRKLHEMHIAHSHAENEYDVNGTVAEEHRQLHEMGINHSHDENTPHTHKEMDEEHRKLHEMGVPHSHSENESHIHDNFHSHDEVHEEIFRGRSNEVPVEDHSTEPVSPSPAIHELRISQTTGVNETTIEVHVEVTEGVVDKLLSSADIPLSVSTQQIFGDGTETDWDTRIIPVRDITISDLTTLSFLLGRFEPGEKYNVKVSFENASSPIVTSYLQKPLSGQFGQNETDAVEEIVGRTSSSSRVFSASCSHDGVSYDVGETFFIGCKSFCMCDESLETKCFPFDCPDTVGLDLAEPTCLEWDIDPDFVPQPPQCCPKLVCTRYSDCHYMGQHFSNYEELPRDLTGCSQKCVCELGNVTCVDACESTVDPNVPPAELPCDQQDAVLVTLPGENCCVEWQCVSHPSGIPGVFHPLPFPVPGHHPDSPYPLHPETHPHDSFPPYDPHGVSLPSHPHDHPHGQYPPHHLLPFSPGTPFGSGHETLGGLLPSTGLAESGIQEPVITTRTEDSIMLFFSIPNIYKGLTGDLYVRYTDMPEEATENWIVDHVLPSGALLGSSDWDHKVSGLKPATDYIMQVVLMISRTNAEVTSPRFIASTLEGVPSAPTSLDAELEISSLQQTSAVIGWRALSESELMHIDGVQVKYKDINKQLMEVSPMLHHSTRQYHLQDLLPDTTYTVDVTFLPINHQDISIMNIHPINFTTLTQEKDPYDFNLEISLGEVTAYTAQIFYSGVPQPEEKYVNVYQLEYLREDDRVHEQMYKSPKQDFNFQDMSENVLGIGNSDMFLLESLKPDQTYQAWLVAYLSNGKVLKSKVIDVLTLAGSLPVPERSELESAGKEAPSYYGALVAVAIIAAIATLGFMALMFILCRRQNHAQATAHINTSRDGANKTVASAAYDNPSYKTYDMEMNGMKNTNGSSVAEGP